jgi:hypothetical protein
MTVLLKEGRSLLHFQLEHLWQKLPHYKVYQEWQFIRLCQYTQIMGRQQMWRGTVGENHNRATAAQVNTHLADHFHKNCLKWASQVMVIWVVLHSVPYIRESLRLENTQGSLRSCSVMVWAVISWYSILLVPLLSFMAKLLQGSTWTG